MGRPKGIGLAVFSILMVSPSKKFERWSARVPKSTQYLIQLVMDELVPQITRQGFVWVQDYGSGKGSKAGANVIPLQVRSGESWQTIELFFSPKGRPWFRVQFGRIRDGFHRYDGTRLTKEQATLTDAPEYYALAKDQGTVSSLFTQFGYNWWVLFSQKTLDSEVAYANRILPDALKMLSEFLPSQSSEISDSYISKNIYRIINPIHRNRLISGAKS